MVYLNLKLEFMRRWSVRATVRGVSSPCNLTFSGTAWQKIVAQIRGVFRKIITHYPPGGRILARNYVFTPTFCLHTVTTGSGDMPFGYFLMTFHVLIEIYPLVPFPPSVRERVSDYTRTSLQWTPLTVARTRAGRTDACVCSVYVYGCRNP